MMRLVLASASPARKATLISAGITPTVIVSDVDEDSILANMARTQNTHTLSGTTNEKWGPDANRTITQRDTSSPYGGTAQRPESVATVTTDATDQPNTLDARHTVLALAQAKNEAITQGLSTGAICLPPDPLFTDSYPERYGHRSPQRTQDSLLVLACDSMFELDGTLSGKPHTSEQARINVGKLQGRSGHLWTGHYLSILEPTHDVHRPYICRSSMGEAAFTTVHFAQMTDQDIDAYVASGEPLEVAGSFTLDGLGGAFISGIEGDPHLVVGVSLPLTRVLAEGLGVSWPQLWDHRRISS